MYCTFDSEFNELHLHSNYEVINKSQHKCLLTFTCLGKVTTHYVHLDLYVL